MLYCSVPGKTGLGWSASHFLLCYCTLRAAAALHNKLCSGRDLISSPPILFRNRGKWKVTILLPKWRRKVIAVSISVVCVGMLPLDTGKQSFPNEEERDKQYCVQVLWCQIRMFFLQDLLQTHCHLRTEAFMYWHRVQTLHSGQDNQEPLQVCH